MQKWERKCRDHSKHTYTYTHYQYYPTSLRLFWPNKVDICTHLRDKLGHVVLQGELQLGPQVDQRWRRVKVHVVRVVHDVLVRFEVPEPAVLPSGNDG